jgi:hypothetical protein
MLLEVIVYFYVGYLLCLWNKIGIFTWQCILMFVADLSVLVNELGDCCTLTCGYHHFYREDIGCVFA